MKTGISAQPQASTRSATLTITANSWTYIDMDPDLGAAKAYSKYVDGLVALIREIPFGFIREATLVSLGFFFSDTMKQVMEEHGLHLEQDTVRHTWHWGSPDPDDVLLGFNDDVCLDEPVEICFMDVCNRVSSYDRQRLWLYHENNGNDVTLFTPSYAAAGEYAQRHDQLTSTSAGTLTTGYAGGFTWQKAPDGPDPTVGSWHSWE